MVLNSLAIYVLWLIDSGNVQVSTETSPLITKGKKGKWFIKAISCGVFLQAVHHEAHIETFPCEKHWWIITVILTIHWPRFPMKFVSANIFENFYCCQI